MWILVLLLSATSAEPIAVPQSWGLQVDVASSSKVPFLGRIHVLTRSLAVARWVQGHEGLLQSHEVCRVRVMDDTRMSETTIPQAFVEALSPALYAVDLSDGLRLDQGVSHLGYRPGGTVPIRDDDPAVLDHEGDGHPGATVEVAIPMFGRVEMYVVQRGHTVLAGAWEEDRYVGTSRLVSFTQHTVGSSHKMFAKDGNSLFNADHSRFEMWPVPDGTDCGTLEASWTPASSPWLAGRRARKR